MKDGVFRWDDRLSIHIPCLDREWDQYGYDEQSAIIAGWERTRGSIPDRIKQFEHRIKELLARLGEEDSFERSCRINDEISDYASRINDLQIWYRMDQDIDADSRRHL